MTTGNSPTYPLRVAFDDGDEWVLDSPVEAACSLEWFDSDDSTEKATVTDANGRRVRVRVVAHHLDVCELIEC
jgi:hypothetical protein